MTYNVFVDGTLNLAQSTIHMQKITVKNHSVQTIEWKRTDGRTDRHTVVHGCTTFGLTVPSLKCNEQEQQD